MPVHDIAQRGFDTEASTYDRTRPSYPSDAVAWMVGQLGIGPESLADGRFVFSRRQVIQKRSGRIMAYPR